MAKIEYKNISNCEWFYIIPSIGFHLSGERTKYNWFNNLFPSKINGFQIVIKWLWFQLFIDVTPNKIMITGNDAKRFIMEREKQIKNIDNKTTANKKKRLKLINDYKSVEK